MMKPSFDSAPKTSLAVRQSGLQREPTQTGLSSSLSSAYIESSPTGIADRLSFMTFITSKYWFFNVDYRLPFMTIDY
jgi:hypothetical protein